MHSASCLQQSPISTILSSTTRYVVLLSTVCLLSSCLCDRSFQQEPRRARRGLREARRDPYENSTAKKTPPRSLFECFSYVCPEPVLVKQCIMYIWHRKRDACSYLPLPVPWLRPGPTVPAAPDIIATEHSRSIHRRVVLSKWKGSRYLQ